jgi:hypothetical protein
VVCATLYFFSIWLDVNCDVAPVVEVGCITMVVGTLRYIYVLGLRRDSSVWL